MADGERGRPSDFTLEIGEEICRRLSEGEPLAQICRDTHMPTDRTVRNWREANEDFSSAIACARETGFDAIALDCLHIADDSGNDTKFVGQEGQERAVADSEWISRSKLRVETRLKLLAKWDPRRYGEKVELTHAGSIQTVSDEHLDARLTQLLGKAGVDGVARGEGSSEGAE